MSGALRTPPREKTELVAWVAERFNNDEPWVCGQEAKYYVRAGLDPAYATPESRDRLLRRILTGTSDPLLNQANRIRCAAAALAGWVASHEVAEPTSFVWHRFIGGTAVQVATR